MTKIDKKMIKEEKGIALITLAITVALLVIITTTLALNSYTSVQLSNMTKLQNDIEMLNDRVAAYFVQYGELPIYNKDVSDFSPMRTTLVSTLNDMAQSDGDQYYTIDISKLNNLTLNYGDNWDSSSSKDRYIINETSHVIYYLEGIKYDGEVYHTVGANQAVI